MYSPGGDQITYTYNASDNRPYQVKLNGGVRITYNSYDNNGNLQSMTDENGSRSFTYDELDRIKTYTDSFGKIVAYDYDFVGNTKIITYPTNKVVNYTYDADDRLSTVTDWLGSGQTIYTYDNDTGILQTVINPNGTKTEYNFDSANRPIGLSNKKADNTVFSSYNLTLNHVGNPTQSMINQPSIPTPIATNAQSSYDDANKLTAVGSVSYTYDPKGNLAGFEGNTFSFDYANRLAQASIGGGHYSYLYDGFGNRISRTKDGVQTKYILDVNGEMTNVLADTDANGAIQNYYIYGHGLISKITNAGQRYIYHYDNLGNTIAITDTSGNFTERYGYDEFGKALAVSETNSNLFRYVGKYGVMDEGNGLLFMRARYYDVNNGRFISKDPIGFEGGDLNLYAYVGENPVMGIDPNGHMNAWLYKHTNWADNKELVLTAKIIHAELTFVMSFNYGTAAIATGINSMPTVIEMINGTLSSEEAFLEIPNLLVSLGSSKINCYISDKTKGIDFLHNKSWGEGKKLITEGIGVIVDFVDRTKNIIRAADDYSK